MAKPGDVVRVRVLGVDIPRKRISLSCGWTTSRAARPGGTGRAAISRAGTSRGGISRLAGGAMADALRRAGLAEPAGRGNSGPGNQGPPVPLTPLGAAAIVAAFDEPFTLGAGPAMATATVGVAVSADSNSPGDLVRQADLALYAAKVAGKRQWRRYQPVLSAGMMRRRDLQAALDSAVAGVGLHPRLPADRGAGASGDVAGFEALLRWPHAEWGMVQPDQFIALAEETGHIIPLGAWVLQQATADTRRWQQQAPRHPPVYVSVNVSARQLRDPGFVRGVQRSGWPHPGCPRHPWCWS